MIRDDRFVLSRRQYAVDLHHLSVDDDDRAAANAVWFRRRNGRTMACIGVLWDYQSPVPSDVREFLTRHDDGRYGGDCHGRWDGKRYWGAQEPEVIAEHMGLLMPMLGFYPEVPAGYDGWWRF
jgi:hypothetical protein